MNDQDTTSNELDDTEAHRTVNRADAESAEGNDDVEGHRSKHGADAESAEGDDDVEGHKVPANGGY
jgi:hypothetical protein